MAGVAVGVTVVVGLIALMLTTGGAQKTSTFESYIYWSGSIGRAFAEALGERARAGVKVHLLLDWLGGSKLDAAQVAVTPLCILCIDFL